MLDVTKHWKSTESQRNRSKNTVNVAITLCSSSNSKLLKVKLKIWNVEEKIKSGE